MGFRYFPRMLGAADRWRRETRRRILEPVLLGTRSLRETVLNALAARGHLIYCELPEGRFFVDPGDRVVGNWLMWHGGWQRGEIEEMTALLVAANRLPPNAVFVDVGANIGTHTVYALRTGRFARAIACEPEPKNFRLLQMNVEANGLSGRVTAVPKALGKNAGTASLHLHPRNKGGHSLRTPPSRDGQNIVEVATVRLDDLLRENQVPPKQIGAVWIDVEGFEPEVAAGLGDYLGRVPLVIEFAPHRYSADDDADFRDLLMRHYTQLHRLGPRSRAPEPISALKEIDEITDILVY